ncbi:MAG: hypothetical protein IJ530_11315 [Treponema sp.]|uniref:hypothetical protein n=1 Tax=Treponema sp. TaxID=166 RepID=UPI0025E963F9|nr:hypothetical protein [Treponema sp.]MBQ8680337.1 hypothetical protein [Treponema sp.]
MALNLATIKSKTEESRGTVPKEEIESEIFKDPSPATGNSSLITISKIAAEKFMLAIEECVGDIEEQKALVDRLVQSKNEELQGFQSETIEKFNALIDATRDLSEKIKATESYENYLQEQVKNADLSKQVAMLETQLQKEKAEFSSFLIKTDSFLSMKVGELSEKVSELKSADEVIETNIQRFKDELKAESTKYTANAERTIEEAADSFVKGAGNQYESLKADCNAMLKSYTEKCQQHLDTIKKQSIDFLKQCEAENKKLIEKVPAVANAKFSKKDVIIYTLAGVSIASLLVQMFV